jgi:hypothetical protein
MPRVRFLVTRATGRAPIGVVPMATPRSRVRLRMTTISSCITRGLQQTRTSLRSALAAETGIVGQTCRRPLRVFGSARTRARENVSTPLRLGIASRPTSSKHVYRPCSGNNASTDPCSPRNHALLPRANLDAFSVRGDCVATLDNEEVLIKFMDMLLGIRVCAALPEGDLSPVGSVENVPLDVCGVLRRRCDPVRPAFHEARKLMHALGANHKRKPRNSCTRTARSP